MISNFLLYLNISDILRLWILFNLHFWHTVPTGVYSEGQVAVYVKLPAGPHQYNTRKSGATYSHCLVVDGWGGYSAPHLVLLKHFWQKWSTSLCCPIVLSWVEDHHPTGPTATREGEAEGWLIPACHCRVGAEVQLPIGPHCCHGKGGEDTECQ